MGLEYIYASLLLYEAGKEISEESLRRVLEAAGLKVDEIRLKATVAALREINIGEVLKSAAAAPVAVPVAAPAAAPAPAEKPAEEKREEKEAEEEKKELSEEDLAAGLSALFG